MAGRLDTDYLVIGAGAMGMSFTDSLVDHADVHVTIVDRRHAPGGHWQDAYPFVRLHQASQMYGVASTVLGAGAVQTEGPEKGLHERARRAEIQHYFDQVMFGRLVASGRVTFLGGCEYRADGDSHLVTSLVSGESWEIDVRRRIVDARYIGPTIPATLPAPFDAAEGVHVAPIGELPKIADASRDYLIVGSGKTATDGIVWLLTNGVSPDRISWVRPRDPWMLDRAVIQPDPVISINFVADVLEAAAEAESLDELFLRLEAAGAMLRLDSSVTPTMAKTPTLGRWELELLQTVEDVIRLGHIRRVESDRIVLEHGTAPMRPGALVIHCAASGLGYPPIVPVWQPDAIRIQLIRAGFPCFNAAMLGYVEATRDDDRERNRLCPPNTMPNDPKNWTWMQLQGARANMAQSAEPDIAAWADGCALNPTRVGPGRAEDPAVQSARARVSSAAAPGLAAMAALVGESS